jgi:hypothetical protein
MKANILTLRREILAKAPIKTPLWNRTEKPLAIALSGVRRGLRVRDDEGNVSNVQYKSNQNCHYASPPYNECILIIFYNNNKK